MTILVTGDEGFIGSHLKRRLNDLWHDVIGMDLKSGLDICDRKKVDEVFERML
jgi:nucleoside-diphosphate-sugar epimerase